MGCCLGLLGVWLSPRLILFLIWLLTDWTTHAFRTMIWPLLGFLFLPFATLFYLISMHYQVNVATGATVFWTIVGLILDLSLAKGMHKRRP